MKLTDKQTKILSGLIIALFMSLAMSFAMVIINVGIVQGFFMIWMKSFFIGFVVAVPVSMIAVPLSQKIVKIITKNGK